MLTALLFAALLQPNRPHQPTTLECANIVDAQTPLLKSSSGIEATLKVHTEDDHYKDTHICESDYTLAINQNAPSNFFSNDDAWGRPIAFRLEGYTQDQTKIFGIISEGGKYPTLEMFAYHLANGTFDTADLIQAFPRSFNSTCIVSLSVIGTTTEGTVVLSSEASPYAPQKAAGPCEYPATKKSRTHAINIAHSTPAPNHFR